MSRLRGLLAFWYDFVVGDDWRTAAGVLAALALTGLLSGFGAASWWVLPLAVLVLLPLSLRRAVRREAGRGRRPAHPQHGGEGLPGA